MRAKKSLQKWTMHLTNIFLKMFFKFTILFLCLIFWCFCVDESPKNNEKNKQIVTHWEQLIREFDFDDENYSNYLSELLANDEKEMCEMEAMENNRAIEEGQQQNEIGTEKGNGTKTKGKEKEHFSSEKTAHHKKAIAKSVEKGKGKKTLAEKAAELKCKKQMEQMQKAKDKAPMEENYTKIEGQKVEKVIGLVEQFVEKSDKRWAHFHGMIDKLLANEFEEKRQKLAKRKRHHGIELKILDPIAFVYGKRRNALILSAQTIDFVLFGIEISMSFLGVPTEILQNELNECTRLIIRHSACKLVKAQPILDELSKSVDTFGGILMKVIGSDNAKSICMIRQIMRFLQISSANPSSSSANDQQKEQQQQQQRDGAGGDDQQQQLSVPLHNLNIYVQFYRSMARISTVFYTEPNVHNEQILRDVFGTLLAFSNALIEQFNEYSEMAKREGIEQMKEAICQ